MSVGAGVLFDIRGDGQLARTGWVAPTDGLLALDLNGDGAINNGSELFGSAAPLADGSKASDGYAALRAIDSNADGVINSQDAVFGNLRVWVDANSDGISQANELSSLAERGITQLDLNAQAVSRNSQGNWVGLESSYQTVDGQSHAMADVWLTTNGNVGPDMRQTVSALTQGIAAFEASTAAANADGSLTTPLPKLEPGPLLASVDSMVSTLSRFDPGTAFRPAPTGADVDGIKRITLQDTSGNGYLVAK